MKNKYIILGLALILMLPLLVSCGSGISQEQYDQVNNNLTATLAEVQTLQSDFSAAQAHIKQLQDDLATSQQQTEAAKIKIEIINAIFLPALKGELESFSDAQAMNLFLGWRDQIMDIGDASLTAKFQAMIDSNDGDAETLAFFVYLFESLPKTLE